MLLSVETRDELKLSVDGYRINEGFVDLLKYRRRLRNLYVKRNGEPLVFNSGILQTEWNILQTAINAPIEGYIVSRIEIENDPEQLESRHMLHDPNIWFNYELNWIIKDDTGFGNNKYVREVARRIVERVIGSNRYYNPPRFLRSDFFLDSKVFALLALCRGISDKEAYKHIQNSLNLLGNVDYDAADYLTTRWNYLHDLQSEKS